MPSFEGWAFSSSERRRPLAQDAVAGPAGPDRARRGGAAQHRAGHGPRDAARGDAVVVASVVAHARGPEVRVTRGRQPTPVTTS